MRSSHSQCGWGFQKEHRIFQCISGLFDELPPAIIHTECLARSMACQSGYFCGPYGCTRRRRTFGVKSFDSEASTNFQLTSDDPNWHFARCCEANLLPDDCLKHCSFETYGAETITSAMSVLSTCPAAAIPTIHYCASQRQDHTHCCSLLKVPEECLTFCSTPGNRIEFQPQHVNCLQFFHVFKECFKRGFDPTATIKQSVTFAENQLDR